VFGVALSSKRSFGSKRHNRLYDDILISEFPLSRLPEDGVPIEITSVARHEEDEDVAIRESEGYVPDVHVQLSSKLILNLCHNI
jgi:hypothetical protein